METQYTTHNIYDIYFIILFLQTSIAKACAALSDPKQPISLRNTSQCLVGVARIHLKQVEYLHQDCNEAFSKLRLKFK